MAATQRSPYAVGHGSIDDIEKGHLMHEFADAIVRQGFVRKVFGELRLRQLPAMTPGDSTEALCRTL